MAISATIIPGRVFEEGEAVSITTLNQLGNPTVNIEGAVSGLQLTAGSISNSHLASDIEIPFNKLGDLNDGQVIVGNGSSDGTATAVTMSGDVTITNAGVTSIADDSIDSDHYVDGSIDSDHLAADAVTSGAILDDAVTYAKIQNVVEDERILGRVSGADGVVEELTKAQVLTMIGVSDGADVTDATSVGAAGALMDSEVTDLDGIKSLTVPNSTTISTFGATLVDDADAAAARTTLGAAALASPALTGTPTAPTAGSGTDTTQIATTAFVQQEFTKANINGHAYPVGSIYTSILSTNPATLLGVGTWSSFGAGRVLVGRDGGDSDFDSPEETGGAKDHTLTVTEIPAHSHTFTIGNESGGGHAADGASSTPTVTTSETGGGQTHNNLQPYIVVYFWKRTA